MSKEATKLSLWESVDKELENLFPADVYEMWFDGLVCKEETDSKIVLTAPNEFNSIWIENNYLDLISKQACSFVGGKVSVLIETAEEQPGGAGEQRLPAPVPDLVLEGLQPPEGQVIAI